MGSEMCIRDSLKPPKFRLLRTRIINYLTYFHSTFNIKDEHTLFLAVKIFDNFLVKNKSGKDKLQRLGSACMLLAEKYEEIYPTSIEYYIKLSARSFTQEQLVKEELRVSEFFNHHLKFSPSHYKFFSLFIKLTKSSEEVKNIGNLLLHL